MNARLNHDVRKTIYHYFFVTEDSILMLLSGSLTHTTRALVAKVYHVIFII